MPWNPDHYLAFGDLRLRPALDLLGRIPTRDPQRIADLGCGPGHITALLAERWPTAKVTGIDQSRPMLDRAAADFPALSWVEADLATWRPGEPLDLIFSNAALHWLDDHPRLFRDLVDNLVPGGTLAVQMPNNFAAPSHRCAYEAAAAGPWSECLAPLLRPAPLLSPQDYYALLRPLCGHVEIWETEYLQVLKGDNPVADWTRTSLLVPLLEALPPAWQVPFEAEYRARVAAAYPNERDGHTLFPFRRLFMIARR
ncbi:MAG: methyltransferase domain-containing protein [Zoogloeaceae bacterium]|nr:methyltransferase domain-containing protein [Zoogloeaceae bacterium]